jgi:hypothetical protein
VEKHKESNQLVMKSKFLRSTDDFDPIALMNFNGNWSQMPYDHSVEKKTIKR